LDVILPLAQATLEFVTAMLVAYAAWRGHQTGKAVQAVHLAVNSRLDQMLAVVRSAATAEGVLQGRAEGEKKP
jgi:hypothetical protein